MASTCLVLGLGCPGNYCPALVDRIWLWVHYNKIPIYPVFYLLKRDYTLSPKSETLNPKP